MDDDVMDLAAQLLLTADSSENEAALPSTASDLDEASAAVASTSTADHGDSSRSTASCVVLTTVSEPPCRDDHNRRRRNREAVARHRQLRRERVDLLHEQTTQLQHIFRQVLAHHKHIADGTTSKTPLQRFQMKFTELVRTREALLLEKQELLSRMAVHDQRARALQSISEHVFSKSMFQFPRTPGGVWLKYDEDEAPFYYEPVSEALCRKTIALGLKKMAQLLHTLPKPSVVNMSNLLGWTTERAFTFNERGDPVMLFRFSRHLAMSQTNLSIDDMLARSWKRYTTTAVLGGTQAAPVRQQVVQQVHDDITIMVRNAPEMKGTWRSRYLALHHKTQTDNDPDADPRRARSAMVGTLLMSHTPREDVDESSSTHHSHNWLKDGCAILRFSEKPTEVAKRDAGIDVEYMGFIEILNKRHGEHMWAVLSLFMLRWELDVVSEQLLPR